MGEPSLQEMYGINDEIHNRIPNPKQALHDLASAINLLVAGYYYEAYETYIRYSRAAKQIDVEEQFKVMTIAANGLIKEKEYEKAETILTKAKMIYGYEALIINNLAVVLFKLGKKNEAVALLEEGLKEVPDNPEMNRNYKRIVGVLC